MKVPLNWLREYVSLEMPIPVLAERLAISTCEVERVTRHGVVDSDGNLGLYRVGRVLEAAKHPNADRLQLCQVDIGEGDPRQIVCGAWNFGPGATVAVALPGAVLPGGQKLERAKLRGQVSDGMILSERELELGTDNTGILVLPAGPNPGTPLAEVVPLGDHVLEVEVTGNRPDLLSIYGIAREVAALFELELGPIPGREPSARGDEPVDIRVEDRHGCPVYIGRLFRDVRVEQSPLWLKARILAAGMRPISNVVDITNYAMLCLGSPLHAFDFARLAEGRIVVRRAEPGEELRTLDGDVRRLEPSDLMIADGARSVAVAGIMGGEHSEVTAETTEVLLEAANFEPTGIIRTSERLGLRTEASNRWEKGVDPYLAAPTAALATELLVELVGARYAGESDVRGEPPTRSVVKFRTERANALSGVEIPAAVQRRLLGRLGFEVEDDWSVTVPTWRARDVTNEADLVEEIARVHLDEIPFTLPRRSAMHGRLAKEQRLRRYVEDVLVGCGLSEAYTSSLVAEDDDPAALRLPVPLSIEQAVLRTTLWRGLVAAAAHNVDAANEQIALFEIARVYLPQGEGLPDERWRVGGIAQGGFFRAKGVVETLLSALKLEAPFRRTELRHLHPGKAADVGGGWVGELHPSLLEGAWGLFELDLAWLVDRVPERLLHVDVMSFPSLRQDLAFVVAESVAAGELVDAAREAGSPELREVRIFDVYRGGQIPRGKKSVALALTFQSPERTLSDDDATLLRERIVAAIGERFGAELRA